MGHITADTELKQAGDKSYAKFSLAVDTRAKINGEWGKRTTFWRCTVWGKDAEWLARDAHKGSLVLVAGEPYSEDYTDKEGNKKTSAHHVQCRTARCLERKAAAQEGDAVPTPPPRRPAAPAADDDSSPPF
jgi:single-strand DNA-binding protein